MRIFFRPSIAARAAAALALSLAAIVIQPALSSASGAAESPLDLRVDAEGFARLKFDELAAFPFDPPPIDPAAKAARRTGEAQIPAEIKRWSGRRVVLTGYMVPVKTDRGLVSEFMLMRYAVAAGNVTAPTINEWVIVRLKSSVPPVTRLPVSCAGVFHVGAIFENGYMVAIYELDAEKVGEG